MVALAVIGGVRADVSTCGTWNTSNTCQAPGGDSESGGLIGQMQFWGTVAGDFFLDHRKFGDSNCAANTENYQVHVIGNFNDQGPPSESDQSLRRMVFNFSAAWVTPKSQDGLNTMEQLCPCNSTGGSGSAPWAIGSLKSLMSCDPKQCDISFLGGINIMLDTPAFTIVNSSGNGFSLGMLYTDPQVGFNSPDEYLTYDVKDTPCTVTESMNLCGQFETNTNLADPCEVIIHPIDNTFVGGKSTSFTYRGPTGDVPTLNAFGVYTRVTSYFSDSKCQNLEATVSEFGSMGYFTKDQIADLMVLVKSAVSMTVTPAPGASSWATVANLTSSCACGTKSWQAGVDRIITSCPTDSCEAPVFNDWNEPGWPLYAYVNRNTTTLDSMPLDTLSFGSWNISQSAVEGGQGLKYALETTQNQDDTCTAAAFSQELCGTYASACGASAALFDVMREVTISGSTQNSTSEGRISWTQTVFNSTGNGCAQQDALYMIDINGFFSQDSFANVPNVQGLSSINVEFNEVVVTPNTAFAASRLADPISGCPCGGVVWAANVATKLFNCPPNTCPVQSLIMPGGTLGLAGYGVAQYSTKDQVLRISAFQADMNDGYSAPFDLETVLLTKESGCPVPQHPKVYPGCWYLPCYRASDGGEYSVTGIFDVVPSSSPDVGAYLFNKTVFSAGNGCSSKAEEEKLFYTRSDGQFKVLQDQSPRLVANGTITQLSQNYVSITPASDAGTQLLKTNCASCAAWTTGAEVQFVANECDCTFVSNLIGIPLGAVKSFGITKVWDYGGSNQKVDDSFRMSFFSKDVLNTIQLQFTRDNGEFTALASDCSFTPRTPAKSGGKKPSGMQGGDVFILLLFIVAIVYFGGGMVLNYQRTGGMKNGGTPVIPHVTFWRSLPSLVADGFRFTFLQRCGTKGSGGYDSFGNIYTGDGGEKGGEKGGYGAL